VRLRLARRSACAAHAALAVLSAARLAKGGRARVLAALLPEALVAGCAGVLALVGALAALMAREFPQQA
jgi:hypothetical protein